MSDTSEFCELLLDIGNLPAPPLSGEGLGGTPDASSKRVRVRIGRRPFAIDLRELYSLNGRTLPGTDEREQSAIGDYLKLFPSHKIYLATHVFSVTEIGSGWLENVRTVGYEMEFTNPSDVTVLDVLPRTEFVKWFEVENRTRGEVNASIDAGGQASIPALHLLGGAIEKLGYGASITLGTETKAVGNLSFAVVTPVIQTSGIGDNTSEWTFSRKKLPLTGDFVLTQTVLVSKHQPQLHFRARVFADLAVWNKFSAKLKSEWVPIQLDLN
jgi:hypothetical protein